MDIEVGDVVRLDYDKIYPDFNYKDGKYSLVGMHSRASPYTEFVLITEKEQIPVFKPIILEIVKKYGSSEITRRKQRESLAVTLSHIKIVINILLDTKAKIREIKNND